MAALTAFSASGLTLCPPWSTRDTVPRDIPASRATSWMVGGRRRAGVGSVMGGAVPPREQGSDAWSGLYGPGEQVEAPIALQRQEQRDQRQHRDQRAGDHQGVEGGG